MLVDHGSAHLVHVSLHLGHGESRLDAAQHLESVTAAAVFTQVVGGECQRPPDLVSFGYESPAGITPTTTMGTRQCRWRFQ